MFKGGIPRTTMPCHTSGCPNASLVLACPRNRTPLRSAAPSHHAVSSFAIPPSWSACRAPPRRASSAECSAAPAPAAAPAASVTLPEGEEFYDVEDAAPAPCFENSESWSATHLKKAQRLRQHDSRPGSQSLASRVRDVVRRPSLGDIAKIESR